MSLVTIARYNYLHEAVVARSILDAEGIAAYIPDEIVSGLYSPGVVGGVRLQVAAADRLRAEEALRQAHEFDAGDDAEADPPGDR